jgi:hypothetical protein
MTMTSDGFVAMTTTVSTRRVLGVVIHRNQALGRESMWGRFRGLVGEVSFIVRKRRGHLQNQTRGDAGTGYVEYKYSRVFSRLK